MSQTLFLSYRPEPPLNEFVDYFWLAVNAETPRNERILPSGTIELVVNLRDDEVRIYDPAQLDRYRKYSGIVVSGTYSRAFACDARQHASMFGVHFKPGGAFPFIGAQASDLTDTHASLADLWGRLAVDLREQLCEVKTPMRRFHVMEEVLTKRLRRSPRRHPAVQMALQMFESTGVGAAVQDVAREVSICKRHFIQLFSAEVGLTPKLFCRLLRFQRARVLAEQFASMRLDRMERRQVPSVPNWAELATRCGYFDQSHLINDFKEFSGLSPTQFLRQHQCDARLKDNHVPISR
jgi:AraC-like DNA-binding protein